MSTEQKIIPGTVFKGYYTKYALLKGIVIRISGTLRKKNGKMVMETGPEYFGDVPREDYALSIEGARSNAASRKEKACRRIENNIRKLKNLERVETNYSSKNILNPVQPSPGHRVTHAKKNKKIQALGALVPLSLKELQTINQRSNMLEVPLRQQQLAAIATQARSLCKALGTLKREEMEQLETLLNSYSPSGELLCGLIDADDLIRLADGLESLNLAPL